MEATAVLQVYIRFLANLQTGSLSADWCPFQKFSWKSELNKESDNWERLKRLPVPVAVLSLLMQTFAYIKTANYFNNTFEERLSGPSDSESSQ